MKSKKLISIFSLLSLCFLQPANASPNASMGVAGSVKSFSSRKILHRLDEGVERFTLSNGLRVVLFRRTQAPIFAGHVWVKVGGVNENPGKTGVAHLLEHMAFKGSTTVGTKDFAREKELLDEYEALLDELEADRESKEVKGKLASLQERLGKLWVNNEFSRIYQKQGAVGLNAATGKDYTYYTVSLPSVAFELWARMESDRLLNPVFRQFYKEREVVMEERRSRTDDSPGGKMYEALLASAFWMHPNRLPVIGWKSDLTKLRKKDVEEFYQQFYRPDNMVISLVGDLDVATAKPMLERYFGQIPMAEGKIPEVRTVEAAQEGERRVTVHFDAEPRFVMAYHKPVYPNVDDLNFAVVHSLLSEGRSSVLYRELVLEKQLAASVYTSEAPGELFPSLFYVWVTPRHGVSVDSLIDEVQKVLDRLKVKDVAEADLESAKKRVRVDLLTGLASNDGLARTLGHSELLWGNWEVLFEMYDAILSTTKADIKRLATDYLNVENRTIVHLQRKKEKKEVK